MHKVIKRDQSRLPLQLLGGLRENAPATPPGDCRGQGTPADSSGPLPIILWDRATQPRRGLPMSPHHHIISDQTPGIVHSIAQGRPGLSSPRCVAPRGQRPPLWGPQDYAEKAGRPLAQPQKRAEENKQGQEVTGGLGLGNPPAETPHLRAGQRPTRIRVSLSCWEPGSRATSGN